VRRFTRILQASPKFDIEAKLPQIIAAVGVQHGHAKIGKRRTGRIRSVIRPSWAVFAGGGRVVF
jgi:hypothetical protein